MITGAARISTGFGFGVLFRLTAGALAPAAPFERLGALAALSGDLFAPAVFCGFPPEVLALADFRGLTADFFAPAALADLLADFLVPANFFGLLAGFLGVAGFFLL